MRILALVPVNLQRDFFGAPAALCEDLAGQPVLTRTLQRLGTVKGLDGIIVVTEAESIDQVRRLAGPVAVQFISHQSQGPAQEAMRAARAFGRYGWRGGLGGTTVYDELFDQAAIKAAIEQMGAEAIMLVPAGACLLDVGWAGAMLASYRANAGQSSVEFSQAPPGLAGAIFSAPLLQQLIQANGFPGKIFSYDPNRPVADPIRQPSNYKLPDWLIATGRRFIADNRRGLWLCRQIVGREGSDVTGEQACRIAQHLPPEPWPRELTVELTTRRPLEDDLRPPAGRPDLSIEMLGDRLGGLEEPGDLNIMFAGAGDALLHPDWSAAVALAKGVGCVGLATYGTSLDGPTGQMLMESGLDVLQIYIDAVSDEVYAADKQGYSATGVWAGVEAFAQQQRQAGIMRPMVVPTMLKTAGTVGEQDEFFDKGCRLTGSVLVVEPSSASGQWPDRAVVHMAPPRRTPCRRIETRLTLLADGQVALCEEDIRLAHTLGNCSLLEAWRGEAMSHVRKIHADGQYDRHLLCANCKEFHRP
ncbi:MAG: SPASM domain-containing protein [Planctomycetes bacterium]|nr:SPASM domain-containing protein [Planctomycetota bacterium]